MGLSYNLHGNEIEDGYENRGTQNVDCTCVVIYKKLVLGLTAGRLAGTLHAPPDS